MAAVEVLKEAVDITTIPVEMIEKQMFPKAISEEEWHRNVKEFLTNTDDGYTMVETSAEDMQKIEELLETKEKVFSTPYMIKTKCEHCPNCQRQNNFLDVVATGLKVHKPQFLIDVFTGKYGHILNSAPHQRCFCYQCGIQLPEDATKFSAPKEPTAEQKKASNYSFPIYNYRS
ncbi:unnamed protein product [Rotaria sp. Silwood2]|nr:unnamed protein product [Rotaria sp. Silwood2]CAF3162146.1 unnamed protein product [Rotaria sp. Silwood2]CAF3379573.1 unnamed protein product [Rotaria sp. Silwood2]CAF3472475.1 unnamed protein product [Rotaria sp. Silwood2]CAF4333276.1 unnamed protein product [Rotaria sp. Silwood2]